MWCDLSDGKQAESDQPPREKRAIWEQEWPCRPVPGEQAESEQNWQAGFFIPPIDDMLHFKLALHIFMLSGMNIYTRMSLDPLFLIDNALHLKFCMCYMQLPGLAQQLTMCVCRVWTSTHVWVRGAYSNSRVHFIALDCMCNTSVYLLYGTPNVTKYITWRKNMVICTWYTISSCTTRSITWSIMIPVLRET